MEDCLNAPCAQANAILKEAVGATESQEGKGVIR